MARQAEVFRARAVGRARRPRRPAWLVVGAGLVMLAVLGLSACSGEPTKVSAAQVTEVPASSASTPAASGRGGVDVTSFDVPGDVAVRVLAVRFNDPSVAVVDLATGTVTTSSAAALGLPREAISGATLLSDGTVVVWQDGTVRALRPGLDALQLVHTPGVLVNPSWAAPSLRVVPSLDERGLWVVQIGSCCPEEVAGRVELVDLATGAVRATAEVPASTFPVASTAHGLVLNTHRLTDTDHGWTSAAGSQHTVLLGEDGTLTRLARGEALAANDRAVVLLDCADHERRRSCSLDLLHVTTGARRPVPALAAGGWTAVNAPDVPGDLPPWPATAPDGRILTGIAQRHAGGSLESHLVAIHPDGERAELLHHAWVWPRPAAWDQHGVHIVIVDGPSLRVLDLADRSRFVLPDIIPAEHYVVGVR